jgi:uncharacterized membrane protein (DUF2068 family)
MKHPFLVTSTIIWQLLLALGLVGLGVFVYSLKNSPEILMEQDSASAVHGLMLGAAVLGVPGLVLLVGEWGLWKNKRWGWWLSLFVNLAIVGVLIWGLVDDGLSGIDWEAVGITVAFLLVPILLLLPKVRRSYWPGAVLKGTAGASLNS